MPITHTPTSWGQGKQRGNEMSLPLKYKRMAIDLKNRIVAEDSERSNWDRRNQWGEQYCIHGVNIGTWDGPDYMCGACESGSTILEYALMVAYGEYQRDRKRAEQRMHAEVVDAICNAMRGSEDLFDFTTELEPILNATMDACRAVFPQRARRRKLSD